MATSVPMIMRFIFAVSPFFTQMIVANQITVSGLAASHSVLAANPLTVIWRQPSLCADSVVSV